MFYNLVYLYHLRRMGMGNENYLKNQGYTRRLFKQVHILRIVHSSNFLESWKSSIDTELYKVLLPCPQKQSENTKMKTSAKNYQNKAFDRVEKFIPLIRQITIHNMVAQTIGSQLPLVPIVNVNGLKSHTITQQVQVLSGTFRRFKMVRINKPTSKSANSSKKPCEEKNRSPRYSNVIFGRKES